MSRAGKGVSAMRVLLLEGGPGTSEGSAASRLEAAGHEVSRCHDPGAAPFPCNGMGDHGSCPLENDTVDVALVVRERATAEPTAAEDGARCALRRSIPLVVAGEVQDTPYADWAAVVEPGTDAVVDAVTRAATAPLERHTAAARRSLRAVLEHHDLDGADADAEVLRRGGDLRVILRPPTRLEPRVAEMASVRAVGAVRDIDPYPSIIDVVIEPRL